MMKTEEMRVMSVVSVVNRLREQKAGPAITLRISSSRRLKREKVARFDV